MSFRVFAASSALIAFASVRTRRVPGRLPGRGFGLCGVGVALALATASDRCGALAPVTGFSQSATRICFSFFSSTRFSIRAKTSWRERLLHEVVG